MVSGLSSCLSLRTLIGALILCLFAWPATADVGPPAHLQVTEREDGIYTVQWRVPTVLPPRAVPEPAFPESCSPEGDVSVERLAGAWLFTRPYRCETGLGGQSLGLRFPFPDLALTTVVRVNLLSGDRFAHVLSPGEGPWQLPEGTAAPDLLRGAQSALVEGVLHAAGSGIHLGFLLVLGLLGSYRAAIRLVTAFTLAQLASALLAAVLRLDTGPLSIEIGFGVSVALLAREVLRPTDERRRLAALAAVAGLLHGLGLAARVANGQGEGGLPAHVLAILGMDAFHLAGALIVAGLLAWWTRPESRAPALRVPAYVAGAAAIALSLAVALDGSSTQADAPPTLMPEAGPGGRVASPASRRLAPTTPDAAIQSFLAVEPFEVRHEVMLRLSGLALSLQLDPATTLSPSEQPAMIDTLARLVLGSTRVSIDGETPTAVLRRADFLVVDDTGALPRPNPLPEPVSTAVVGVTLAYPASGMAGEVTLAWGPFPDTVRGIPATVIDPESVGSLVLSADKPSLTWENALLEDPIPAVTSVEVEPVRVRLPWLSFPLLALCVALPILGFRRGRSGAAVAAARILLALAILAGPLVQTTAALPGSAGGVPTERQARRILSGLLPNVYRALEYREEALIYDRLAVSVTGDTLTDIYLQQRRALELEERGGAQARVEAVEVLEADDIRAGEPGFDVSAVWTVGGMVTHFGHRHFRQNRYVARVGVVPVEGAWKIRSIEVLEQERLR